jgi:hypothetical protein
MTIHFAKRPTVQFTNKPFNDTAGFLAKARNGEIPVAALENIKLDKQELSLILSKELLVWSSAAEGAEMHLVSVLFSELHKSLVETTKHQVL